jgi:hypothetical protein
VGDEYFTNPDHKLEYTAAQLQSLLEQVGFEVTGAFGIGLVAESIASGEFDPVELATHYGVYAAPADCYFLAYQARKPLTATR